MLINFAILTKKEMSNDVAQGSIFGFAGSVFAMMTKAITVGGATSAIFYSGLGAVSGYVILSLFKWSIKKAKKLLKIEP